MSIFKKKRKEEPKTDETGCACPTPGEGVCTQKAEPKPVIRQAIGYMYNGTLYKTESEAKAAYWVPKLEGLVCTELAYYGAQFDWHKASRNRDKIVALLQEQVPVIPLFSEEK